MPSVSHAPSLPLQVDVVRMYLTLSPLMLLDDDGDGRKALEDVTALFVEEYVGNTLSVVLMDDRYLEDGKVSVQVYTLDTQQQQQLRQQLHQHHLDPRSSSTRQQQPSENGRSSENGAPHGQCDTTDPPQRLRRIRWRDLYH